MSNMINQLILLIVLIGGCLATNCKDGWLADKGSCYFFGHGKNLTFTEAEDFCQERNSHLIHIDDAAENTFIKGYLTGLKRDSFWLGLTDAVIEGEWRWYDTNMVAKYTDWLPSEPNNSDGNDVENCVAFVPDHYGWNDFGCSRGLEPICEMRPSSTIIG